MSAPLPPSTQAGGAWARFRAAGLVTVTIATLAALCLLIWLGTWQLQRKAWKEGLLRDVAQRSGQAPADVGMSIFAAPPPVFSHVRLTGRFLHDKERYWFSDGRLGSGFQVFTPLELQPGHVVWINRGYVPGKLRAPATRIQGQLEGVVTVTGLVREVGERNAFTPANDVAGNVWYWRDLPALQASAFTPEVKFAPVMVDADAVPANPGGWPEGGNSLVALPNRHLEYAVTWYGLALTLIAVYLSFVRSRLSRGGQ